MGFTEMASGHAAGTILAWKSFHRGPCKELHLTSLLYHCSPLKLKLPVLLIPNVLDYQHECCVFVYLQIVGT